MLYSPNIKIYKNTRQEISSILVSLAAIQQEKKNTIEKVFWIKGKNNGSRPNFVDALVIYKVQKKMTYQKVNFFYKKFDCQQ